MEVNKLPALQLALDLGIVDPIMALGHISMELLIDLKRTADPMSLKLYTINIFPNPFFSTKISK